MGTPFSTTTRTDRGDRELMDKGSRIYVAGHRGLVGSAIVRALSHQGYDNLIQRTHVELDLTDRPAVHAFFDQERPEYVVLAAAKVGGIFANDTYPADFIRENLEIETSVIDASYRSGVKRLLFLVSSCIYPKLAPQPIKEEYLLTGPLEPTNRAYALAKIAGVEMCSSYNRQYGTQYLSAMPTNLYGPGDKYDLEKSHVIPALLRKFDDAKRNRADEVVVWGTGTPRREFLYSDDMASATLHLMQLPDDDFKELIDGRRSGRPRAEPALVNIGAGDDITISELARLVGEIVGFDGQVVFDSSKPDGTPRKLMDSNRLYATGWRPTVSLREGLRLAYRDYCERLRS